MVRSVLSPSVCSNKSQHESRYAPHSLLEQGEHPRLADYQISPLHDDDCDEERRVTSVLQLFPSRVCLVA